jgi:hypothetical protein
LEEYNLEKMAADIDRANDLIFTICISRRAVSPIPAGRLLWDGGWKFKVTFLWWHSGFSAAAAGWVKIPMIPGSATWLNYWGWRATGSRSDPAKRGG